jgi:phosphoglycolate phosphatase
MTRLGFQHLTKYLTPSTALLHGMPTPQTSPHVATPTPTPIAIFDFDGTIADSLELVIAEYNRIAPRFCVKSVDPGDLQRLRKMKVRAAMKEHDVSFWKLPFLVSSMRSALHDHVGGLKPHQGVAEALRALAKLGCRCSILSTNSSANISRFLVRHELEMFEHVVGGASLFGKARALKRLIRRAQLDASQVYYIGDEARDVDAATAAGVRSIAVSWGYADRDALASHSPTHIADQPADLLRLLSPRA